MKLWSRTLPGGTSSLGLSYEVVTEVDAAGNYRAMNVWNDGQVDVILITTLTAMGWPSVAAFLSEKSGFNLIEEEEHA